LDIVNSFGWDLGNGSFDGLTGHLQREECDFGGIGSFIRADRMRVVDFTVGTFYRQYGQTYLIIKIILTRITHKFILMILILFS